MPEILQEGTRLPAWVPVGDIDLNPRGWSKDAFVVAGGDITGVTCFPHQPEVSPVYTDTLHGYIADDRAAPDDDLSRNLVYNLAAVQNSKGPFAFSVGVITGVWAVVRAPDAETITAQWYIEGAAVGSQVTFDNDEHMTIRLPDLFYGIENWIRDDTLTLRMWGGLFHISTLTLLPRPFVTHNALDIIDPAATVTTTVADSLSTSGEDVVLATTTAIVAQNAAEEVLLFTCDADYAEQSIDLLQIIRSGPTLTTDTTRYKNYAPYVSGDSSSTVKAVPIEVWVNGARRELHAGWSGAAPTTEIQYTVWTPCFHNQFSGLPAIFGASNTETPLILDTGDDVELRVWNFQSVHLERAFDQVTVGIRIDEMNLVFGTDPNDSYAAADTFDLEWEYLGLDTQGGSEVDRSSLFTSVDGVVFDLAGNVAYQELGLSVNPWTVDLSNFASPGGTYIAIVRGNLPDGSYAYTGWQVVVEGGIGQIYRRL